MPDFLSACEEAARAGGAVLQDWTGRFAVREKGPADLVTEADLASQQVIRERLLGAFPDHGFLAEEEAEHKSAASPYRWIVDPLDGTTNYVHRLPQYCVSIGLERSGELLVGTVYDPVAEECFTASAGQGAFLNGHRLRVSDCQDLSKALVAASLPARLQRGAPQIDQFIEVLLGARAIRRMGSSALNLCYLAAGRFDAYWATDTKPWDVAAGVLLVQEAGGVVTNLEGGKFDIDRPHFIAAANEQLHRQLLQTIGSRRPDA